MLEGVSLWAENFTEIEVENINQNIDGTKGKRNEVMEIGKEIPLNYPSANGENNGSSMIHRRGAVKI